MLLIALEGTNFCKREEERRRCLSISSDFPHEKKNPGLCGRDRHTCEVLMEESQDNTNLPATLKSLCQAFS